jgi:hypothetical protein
LSDDEKMMQMQLRRERYARESEKEKRDGKHASDNELLENKNKAAMLVYDLREQTKDEGILCCELVKKRKDTKESQDVGLIAEGIRQKQLLKAFARSKSRPTMGSFMPM